MLADGTEFSSAREAAEVFDEGLARYCSVSSYLHEGAHVDSIFLGCSFTDVEWYWAFFNCANFIECRFVGCVFRGANFADTRFVECHFERCEFLPDNLGKGCTNNGSRVFGGSVKECVGGDFLFNSGAF